MNPHQCPQSPPGWISLGPGLHEREPASAGVPPKPPEIRVLSLQACCSSLSRKGWLRKTIEVPLCHPLWHCRALHRVPTMPLLPMAPSESCDCRQGAISESLWFVAEVEVWRLQGVLLMELTFTEYLALWPAVLLCQGANSYPVSSEALGASNGRHQATCHL